MLDPRAIARIGIGYGAALVARIGLFESAVSVSTGGRRKDIQRVPYWDFSQPPSPDSAAARRRDEDALMVIGAI